MKLEAVFWPLRYFRLFYRLEEEPSFALLDLGGVYNNDNNHNHSRRTCLQHEPSFALLDLGCVYTDNNNHNHFHQTHLQHGPSVILPDLGRV